MPVGEGYAPETIHARLGEGFYDAVPPARFPRHVLRFRNQRWAERVGLGELTEAEWEAAFARFEPLPGGLEEPLALRYHGYQFRSYNPNLGDGRGFLFAQLRDGAGRLLDLGTKGSGRTPYSRGGDGRLTLKGGVREILATELLEARGVNTSKTFSIFETGEALVRGDEPSPTRSCVMVRLNHSHIRFGSFERQAWERSEEGLSRLVDHVLEHYLTGLDEQASAPARMLAEVARRSAELVASWTAAGFVHGVLNTDNMNVTGESFDYGPWRFTPTMDGSFTAAYFDHSGLYAFGRQPEAVFWSLERLAEALSSITPQDELVDALRVYEPAFRAALNERMLGRLGLVPKGTDEDGLAVQALLTFLETSRAPYDQFFFDWQGGALSEARARQSPEAARYQGEPFERLHRWLATFEPANPARLSDPYYSRQRPTTLLIEEVEALWEPIAERDDWAPLEAKIADIRAIP